jgi:hypothetical protein
MARETTGNRRRRQSGPDERKEVTMAKTTVVAVRLDQAHRAMLAEMAKRNGVTVSMQARMILVAAFNKVAINGDGKEGK